MIQTTPGPLANPVQDTNNNAVDFIFVDTNGTSAGAGQRLGAPGPENTTSPIASDDFALTASALDSCRLPNASPNYVRAGGAYCGPPNDIVSPCVPAQNSTFGTVDIRQTFTNETGGRYHAAAVPRRGHHHVPVHLRCRRPSADYLERRCRHG